MQSPYEQLLLWENRELDTASGNTDLVDVSFLHRSFCIAGLPLRAPRNVMQPWTRNDDTFALTVSPKSIMIPGGKMVDVGVPYGPKARLLAVWMATEAKDPDRQPGDHWLEIGKVTSWLRSIGIAPISGCKGNLNTVKEQLVRLSFSSFTMVMKGVEHDDLGFKNDSLIDGGLFGDQDLELYARGNHGQMAWPKGIRLSEKAYDRFTNHSIPVPTQRLAKIAHSAMALDIFMFLCYQLPRLSRNEGQLVRWRRLIGQFGNGEAPSKFRENFEASIRCALAAYPEAKIDITNEGLVLHYSDPAELRVAYFALGARPESSEALPAPAPAPASSEGELALR